MRPNHNLKLLHRNTRESLGELLEKAVETLVGGSFSLNIARSPKFPLVFKLNH